MYVKCPKCEEEFKCTECVEEAEKERRNRLPYYFELARGSFKEGLAYLDSDEERLQVLEEPHDATHEAADGCVPIYTGDLLALAYNHPDLAIVEPDIGPVFDGSPTPTNIIAANVFEALEADLFEYVEELKAEYEEAEEDEEDDEVAECPACKGKGTMVTHTSNVPRSCNVCNGSGQAQRRTVT